MDPEIESLIRYLAARLECAVCHHQYEPDDFELLNKEANSLMFFITCHHCYTQGFMVVFIQEQWPELEEIDQAEEESEREPITADDVLDMHRFLENFEGDFITLLNLA